MIGTKFLWKIKYREQRGFGSTKTTSIITSYIASMSRNLDEVEKQMKMPQNSIRIIKAKYMGVVDERS